MPSAATGSPMSGQLSTRPHRSPTATVDYGTASQFAGTATLLRLALRRDRWLLLVWGLGLAGMAAASAAATVGMYPDDASRAAAASAVNDSAAMLSMFGPVYDPGSVGELSMFKMTVFGGIAMAILMSLLVIRHTRAEEETGRLELLSAGVLGRAAPLTAAVSLAVLASIAIAVLTALGLVAAGLPASGSIAFAGAWATTGVAFAALAAVVAQLSATARVCREIALGAIAAAYALRAIGDASYPESSLLSWLSPLGWNKAVRAFAGERWSVLLLPLAAAALLVVLALWLRSRRDLGEGLWRGRTGAALGWHSRGVTSLAVRLGLGSWLVWTAFGVAFGLVMGSIIETIEDWLTSDQVRDLITTLGGQQVITDAVLAAYLMFMGVAAAGFGINAALRMRSEEASGHAEVLLSGPTSRLRWAVGFLGPALLGVVGFLLLSSLAMGAMAAFVLSDAGVAARVVASGIAQVPGAWVLTMLVFAVFGWRPRWSSAVWVVFALSVVLTEFGLLWSLPEWLLNLSVFYAAPGLPVTGADAATVAVMLVVAALLAGVGAYGWRRRDLEW